MNYLSKILLTLFLAVFVLGSVQAQKKGRKKTSTQKPVAKKKKTGTVKTADKTVKPTAARPTAENTYQLSKAGTGDTAAPKMVTITSAFKPFLKNAAKVNFTAATPVIDSSKIPVGYAIPSQHLFFSYQPVPIKPLALGVDSGYVWENDQYIKLGAGNFSSYYGEAALSFGDGKTSITNIRGNFLTSTGHLPSQQAAKWGVDILSIFNTKSDHEWTAHPYYQSTTQYLYGYQPATLPYTKESLLQRFTTVGIDLGMQNKTENAFGITYHPQISAGRFFDNNEAHENYLLIKAPINKSFGKIYAFDLGLTADISTANFPLIPNPLVLKNNLYYITPSIQFKTPNVKINAGIQPTWDNTVFSTLPNITAEAKLADINLVLEAGWTGYFQKNSFRSLAGFNPFIDRPGSLLNTKINEQYAGIKGASGDHFTYQVRASLLKFNNQALFLNNTTDGKTFNIVYEPEMNAVRLHGEVGYTEQEKISFTAGATLTQYNSLAVNNKAWGLLPVEVNGSLKWKLLKDLQLKSEVFFWDGSPYQDKSLQARKTGAAADLNLGAEFTVMPRLNLWLQMNNLLNSQYQRWNQYTVLGFNVLGGIVYSFR
ncbi:MAG: hypothetical protein V4450_03505 [Bacteroidota bacterium]